MNRIKKWLLRRRGIKVGARVETYCKPKRVQGCIVDIGDGIDIIWDNGGRKKYSKKDFDNVLIWIIS